MIDYNQNKEAEPYKEPVFLFTSSSMRLAAYAGWYSAFGDKEKTEQFVRSAYSEWAKEIGMGRKYLFTKHFNDDIYNKIDSDELKKLTDKYLIDVKKAIKNFRPVF